MPFAQRGSTEVKDLTHAGRRVVERTRDDEFAVVGLEDPVCASRVACNRTRQSVGAAKVLDVGRSVQCATFAGQAQRMRQRDIVAEHQP